MRKKDNESPFFNMRLPLPGRPKLGNATKAMLSAAAKICEEQAAIYGELALGKSDREVAERCGVNEKTVRARLRRKSLSEIKTHLTPTPPGPS